MRRQRPTGRAAESAEPAATATASPGNAVRAVLKIPPGMLVYPHVRNGRVRYLSARSVEGKRHYNLEAELAGDRQLYCNWLWAPTTDMAVVVVTHDPMVARTMGTTWSLRDGKLEPVDRT